MLLQRRFVLAIADLATLAIAAVASAGILYGWPEGVHFVQERLAALLVPVALAIPLFYMCGLYSTRRVRSAVGAFVPAIKGVALVLGLSMAGWFLTRTPQLGLRFVMEVGLLSVVGLVAVRLAVARSRGVLDTPTLVVGSHQLCADLAALLREHPDAPIRIVGLVPFADERRPHADVPAIFPVLGDLDALGDIVAEHGIKQVIVPSRMREHPELLRRVRPLSYRGVSLVDFVSLYEELAKEIPLDHVDEHWLFDAASAPSLLHIRRLKRVMDVLATLVLFVPAAPLLLLASIAIKLTSRGPIVFSQVRSGIHGRPFHVLKLRTMYQDAEKLTGPVWSTDNDPRITPAGRVLRKFRIDELPQLWNVLRGDMSLVGPRPERPVFVDQLSDAIPHYSERLLVRPGITGWAQVLAPYAASISDSARKLQFDLYYTKNLSLSLDLLILLLTAKTVLFGRERVQGGMAAGQQLDALPVDAANAATALDTPLRRIRRADSGRGARA